MEICVQTMRGYADTLELAGWCEREGVPALAVADHYLAGPDLEREAYDQLVILGGIARETTDLQLSTLVSPLTFRHPAVHLKAAITLDHMSGGRFSLGIGTGWMEMEHDVFGLELYPMGERFDRLEETLEYLAAGLDGTGRGFDGTYYRLAAFDPKPAPIDLRLVVGGSGRRRTPDLAARFADEFNVFPDEESPMAERVARFRETARSHGRDPATLLVSTAFPAALSPTADGVQQMIVRRAERMKATVEEAVAVLDRHEIPHGTADDAAPGFARIAEAGITRIYLQLAGATLDQVAEAVDTARRAAALVA